MKRGRSVGAEEEGRDSAKLLQMVQILLRHADRIFGGLHSTTGVSVQDKRYCPGLAVISIPAQPPLASVREATSSITPTCPGAPAS